MIKLNKRKVYENTATKKLSELDNTYLEEVIKFSNKDNLEDVMCKINYDAIENKYLWALFGKNNKEEEQVCLQVGQSIDIKTEIIADINEMFSKDVLFELDENVETEFKNSQFYTDVYQIKKGDSDNKNEYLYRKIKREYDELTFYTIDIDGYLGIDNFKNNNCVIDDILKFSKVYYAETKFAYETQAIYWNAYRSGVGIETLKILISRQEGKNSNKINNSK